MARLMLPIDLRRIAVLAGVSLLLAGCAPDAAVSPASPDNCILLCALVRSITGEGDVPPPPALPAKKPVHLAPPAPPAARLSTAKPTPVPAAAKPALPDTVKPTTAKSAPTKPDAANPKPAKPAPAKPKRVRPAPKRPAVPATEPLRKSQEPPLPPETSVQPATTAETARASTFALPLPGSAPIAEVTSRFVPQVSLTP